MSELPAAGAILSELSLDDVLYTSNFSVSYVP